MTYFMFLAVFVGIPLAILSVITLIDYRRGKWMPNAFGNWQPWIIIVGLAVVALIYTTPWDNYLVASGVWYYNPQLVTGIIIGYVPIEEYTFFIVLPIATGLWTLLLMRYLPKSTIKMNPKTAQRWRIWGVGITFVIWIVSCVALVLTLSGTTYDEWTYLSLELSWALIPILIQFVFGFDILVRHWRLVLIAILTSTIYLSVADAIAINSGTWTIDPNQSLPILLFQILPIEELVFFAIVNTLVVIGLTLCLAQDSRERLVELERIALFRPLSQRLQLWMLAPSPDA